MLVSTSYEGSDDEEEVETALAHNKNNNYYYYVVRDLESYGETKAIFFEGQVGAIEVISKTTLNPKSVHAIKNCKLHSMKMLIKFWTKQLKKKVQMKI